jgi:hypothetical protein
LAHGAGSGKSEQNRKKEASGFHKGEKNVFGFNG